MARKWKIWYFEGSRAASLVKPHGRHYVLRALPKLESHRSKRIKRRPKPSAGIDQA